MPAVLERISKRKNLAIYNLRDKVYFSLNSGVVLIIKIGQQIYNTIIYAPMQFVPPNYSKTYKKYIKVRIKIAPLGTINELKCFIIVLNHKYMQLINLSIFNESSPIHGIKCFP